MIEGYIKLYRSTLDHWIFEDKKTPMTRGEAWISMIVWANVSDQKVMIGNQLLECKRGQLLYSLETYAKKFRWTVQKVRIFFELLKKEQMINTEGLKYTTRLTICNYDKYQGDKQTENKLKTDCQQTDNKLTTTSKECKEGYKKEINKEKSFTSITEVINDPDQLLPEEIKERRKKIWDEAFASQIWLESVQRNLNISERDVKLLLKEFLLNLYAQDDIYKPFSQVKKHFANWARKNAQSQLEKIN